MVSVGARKLSLFLLVMLITGCIDSIRNVPATALFGSTLVFFFVFSAIVFLIPSGLVAAELSATFSQKSGIYQWVRLAFGRKIAFLAIWLQWINTMVWYPTVLLFIAGTFTYFINPQLAQNKFYLVMMILSVFWGQTFINLRGLHASATFASFCAVVGMVVPMFLIIGMGITWVFSNHPVHLHLTLHSVLPPLHHSESWVSLVAIMTAFLGMELASVHVNHVENPQKTFPRALFISVFFILITMTMASLAIAVVLPQDQIHLVDGVMQAFQGFFSAYHVSWATPILTAMLLIGSVGGMMNWIISPAKGLLQAAEDGFLPRFFQRENRHGVPHRLLIAQALLVSCLCFAFLLMPSVNGSYWLLTDLSTQLYMLMYILMFVSAIRLKHQYPEKQLTFQIPGGKIGMWLTSLLGLTGCLITLYVGFLPPGGIDVGSALHYEVIFTAGMLVMILPTVGFYFYDYLENRHQSGKN